MDIRPVLRVVAIVVLVVAAALGLSAIRRWPTRRTSGAVAGMLAVLALAGFALSSLDLLAPHAPVPDALSVYHIEGDTLIAASAATGTTRWRYTVSLASDYPIPQPLIDHGMVYLRTDGALRALRASDGQQMWTMPIVGRAFDQPTPAVDQGVIYITAPASIIALRATDGSALWQTSPSAVSGSPVTEPHVANGLAYEGFNAAAATVYALDTHDGTIRWKHSEEHADVTSLAVAGDSVYAAFGASESGVESTTIMALDANDGAKRWAYKADGGDANPLAVTNNTLVVSSRQLGLFALDTAKGRLLWQGGPGVNGDLSAGLPIVADGVVYLSGIVSESQSAGVALAIDVRTGRERWRTVLEYADVFMSLAGQMLYVGGRNMYGLRASDGHVVWSYASGTQFYQPVVAGGVVFVGSGAPGYHLFSIGGTDFLNALDARTGHLYWRTSFVPDDPLLVSS